MNLDEYPQLSEFQQEEFDPDQFLKDQGDLLPSDNIYSMTGRSFTYDTSNEHKNIIIDNIKILLLANEIEECVRQVYLYENTKDINGKGGDMRILLMEIFKMHMKYTEFGSIERLIFIANYVRERSLTSSEIMQFLVHAAKAKKLFIMKYLHEMIYYTVEECNIRLYSISTEANSIADEWFRLILHAIDDKSILAVYYYRKWKDVSVDFNKVINGLFEHFSEDKYPMFRSSLLDSFNSTMSTLPTTLSEYDDIILMLIGVHIFMKKSYVARDMLRKDEELTEKWKTYIDMKFDKDFDSTISILTLPNILLIHEYVPNYENYFDIFGFSQKYYQNQGHYQDL